jgi:hypothetical protein
MIAVTCKLYIFLLRKEENKTKKQPNNCMNESLMSDLCISCKCTIINCVHKICTQNYGSSFLSIMNDILYIC